jgi:hypothetical protein
MSGTVAETDKRVGSCVRCGYDLRGSEGRCPECGAAFERLWRSACAAGWLVVPALRMLIWGLPALLGSVCIARYVERARGRGQVEAILDSEAVLLYALPLLACVVGGGLLLAGGPARRRPRAAMMTLAGLTAASVCLAIADHGHVQGIWMGITRAGTASYGIDWSIGTLAAHGAIVGTAAMAAACVSVLAGLGADLGIQWLRAWRWRLAGVTGAALLLSVVGAKLMQLIWVFRVQAWNAAGNPPPGPKGSVRTWMDPTALALAVMAIALTWALSFTVLARIRDSDGPERDRGAGSG